MHPFNERGTFLNFAAAIEGGLLLLALGLGWLVDVSPLLLIGWNWAGLAFGLAAVVPLYVLFLFAFHSRIAGLARIRRLILDTLGAPLSRCRWYDLVLLALLAGVCEETFFRGVLQPWMSRWSLLAALVAGNVIFALAHAVTPTYAVLAGGIGLYLGLLMHWTGNNLLAPIIAHAVYDYLAFVAVARHFRSQDVSREEGSPGPLDGPPDDGASDDAG